MSIVMLIVALGLFGGLMGSLAISYFQIDNAIAEAVSIGSLVGVMIILFSFVVYSLT